MQDTITYFDDDLQEEFTIPAFEDVTSSALQDKYKGRIHRATYESLIKLANNPNWNKVPCFSMNGVVFEIDKELHTEHYENCLAYFTESEEYEICSHLVRLHSILS